VCRPLGHKNTLQTLIALGERRTVSLVEIPKASFDPASATPLANDDAARTFGRIRAMLIEFCRSVFAPATLDESRTILDMGGQVIVVEELPGAVVAGFRLGTRLQVRVF
jgi:hypothetical protein